MPKPTVAFLIPNRNGIQFLEKCYESILSQAWIEPEVILLDQDSTDGSIEFTREKFPGVIIERLSSMAESAAASPASFSYAHCISHGIRSSRAEWVVLFNNDAWLAPDWSDRFVEYTTAHPERLVLASVGYCALEPSKYYSLGDILDKGVVHRIGYLQEAQPGDLEAMPEEVTYPSGYCGTYHRSVLNKTGELVDVFDTYYEDVDLGLRGFRMGFRCWLMKKAVVFHVGGASGHFLKAPSEVQLKQKCTGAWKSGRNCIWFGKRHYKSVWAESGLRRYVLQEFYNHFKWGILKGNPVSRARFLGMWNGLVTSAPTDYLDRLPEGDAFRKELDQVWQPWKPWMEKWNLA